VSSHVVTGRHAELRAAATAQEARRTPAGNPVSWFFRLVREVINKADRDRLLGLAAESAFFAVLTLFPALLVVATILGQLGSLIGEDNAVRVEEAVLTFLDELLTDSADDAIATVEQVFSTGTNALTVATLLALASLSTAFSTLVNTVNIAYDVPETRGWWRRRWLGLLLGFGSVLTGALALTLLVIGPLFGRAEEAVGDIGIGAAYDSVWSWVRWPLAFGALVLWATTMDHLMPNRRTRWRYDLPGGLLTALLWLAASYGLNLYLELVVTSSPIFGALGGGLILMSWFYLLCVALLAGAELNAILLARRLRRAELRQCEAVPIEAAPGGHAQPLPPSEVPASVLVEPAGPPPDASSRPVAPPVPREPAAREVPADHPGPPATDLPADHPAGEPTDPSPPVSQPQPATR
jgi:membrane protein